VNHDWLPKNPCSGIKLPRTCGGKRIERYVCTAGEVNAVVKCLHEPYASLVLFLYVTGVRIGEALAICHEDFRGGLLSISRRILNGEIDTVKTPKSRRMLPVPEPLLSRLKSLSSEGWIFQAQNGSPLDPKNAMNRYVKSAAKRAGLKGINWHSFRHSFQVSQRRAGTHPKLISDLMGHASVSTAMDVYDHASESELQQPLNQLLQDVMKSEAPA
jgi:integrase